jgi:hypothetical protein
VCFPASLPEPSDHTVHSKPSLIGIEVLVCSDETWRSLQACISTTSESSLDELIYSFLYTFWTGALQPYFAIYFHQDCLHNWIFQIFLL